MTAAADDNTIRSRIFHAHDDFKENPPCVWKGAQLGPSINGKRFLEVFPPTEIKAVEVSGDEVTMPTAVVLRVLTEGRFGTISRPITVGSAPGGRVWLNNGHCFQFNILIDPADGAVSSVHTQLGDLNIAQFPQKNLIPAVKTGMTREELEKKLLPDGGISVPFRYERYVAINSKCTPNGEVVKMNFAFKPAGMSDAIYYLGKWVVPKQSPKDTLMRISPVYLETPFYD